MDSIMEKAGEKIGPLAAWQWGLVGAGGFLLFRYIKGQQGGNGTQTVTLQPNASGGVGNPATSTGSIGSLLEQLGAEYPIMSFTLPDGTYFSGQNGIFTTPTAPASSGGSGGGGGGSGGGSGGGTGGYTGILPPYYLRRPGGVLTGVTPNPLPGSRPGGVIPGVTPNPLPGGGNGNPVVPDWVTQWLNGVRNPGGTPPTGPLPVRPGGPPANHTPGILPVGR